MPLSEEELLARDAQRNIGEELLQAILDIKAGRYGAVYQVPVSPVVEARQRASLSQAQFAALLGVSKRTVQDWEQGRRQPTGAARTLLKIAERHPEVLRELAETPAAH
ncbi:MAG: helix-turn-helix domain-containing protein [Candidatus Competibacter sp.]|nr:helix-turn-helix domain-containing protein [Candidatus Competibacter sp.]